MAKKGERGRVLAAGVGLIGGFMRDTRGLRPAARRLGGYDELRSVLHVAYVKAVDAWLASGRSHTLATYAYNHLRWGLISALRKRGEPWRQPGDANRVSYRRAEREAPAFREEPRGDPHVRTDGQVAADALAGMHPKLLAFLSSRFGLGGAWGQSLEQVARRFGVTRERARQLINKALGTARGRLAARAVCRRSYPTWVVAAALECREREAALEAAAAARAEQREAERAFRPLG